MLIRKVLQSALQKLSPVKNAQTAAVQPGISASDGISILQLGDALFEKNRFEEAESAYRRALDSDAPAEQVRLKLQQVVARIARHHDKPGMLLVPPGDGTASVLTNAELYSMLDAVNKELATVP